MKTGTIISPMLATTLKDWNKLDFKNNRYLASPKLDGIRALKIGGRLVSRAFKPIRNIHIRKFLEDILPEGADGEILVGDGGSFQTTSSGVMSENGNPAFTYYIFDLVATDISRPYYERVQDIQEWWANRTESFNTSANIIPLIPVEIKTLEELQDYEKKCLTEGFEGVILRTYDSPYKCGRATEKQQWMLKIKRFAHDEAIIIEFGEKMHNINEVEKDAFGHTRRSAAKAGLVPANTLGYLGVRDLKTDIEFEIGTGFNDELRQEIWDNQNIYAGKIVRYKHFAQTGVKDKPRFPVFDGFRDFDDMS